MSTNYKVILDPSYANRYVQDMIAAANEIDFSNVTNEAKTKFLKAQQRLEDMCLNGIHLGKQSAGWVFAFRAYPEQGIESWADWKRYIKDNNLIIRTQYDETIPFEQFEADIKKTFYYMGKKSGHATVNDEANWIDKDGYDFCNYDFN